MPAHRILFVNGTAHIGGAEVSLLNLVKRLDKSSFISIVVAPCEGPLVDRLRKLKVDVRMTRLMEFSRYRCIPFLWAAMKLASLIKRESIELVHANSIYMAELSFFAASMARVPCICHVRDLVPILGAGKVRSLAFNRMDKLIAISDAVRRDLIERLNVPQDRVVRIYNGVDVQEYHPGISGAGFRQEFNLSSARIVGMVGRLSPEKGHEAFLQAGKEVLRDCQDARLVIIGGPGLGPADFKETLVELVRRLNIEDKVIFTGFREDLPQVMAALDVVVVPSIREPFGRVIIEAMAAGKPVIATSAGGVPEIISEGSGLLVEVGDMRSLKENILTLLKDRERSQEMGRIARKRVVDYFSLKKHVLEMEKLYGYVLE